MSSYRCSDGTRLRKSVIDGRVRKAKAQKLDEQRKHYGWNFCEECDVNSANAVLDCSHDISVDECQKSGRSELAYDLGNITIRCRECHKKHDKTN